VNLGLVLGLGARPLGGGFSPLSLFAAGEQGYWLDPSDFSTMFQDAAGTTPVTAVGQSVRLMLDKSRGLVLGPQLVTNGDFSNGSTGWTLGSGWSVAGGAASFSSPSGAELTQAGYSLPQGRMVEISFDIAGTCSMIVQLIGGGGADPSGIINFASGARHTVRLTASINRTTVSFSALGGTNFSIDNISVRELPGNHFTQANVANAPLLQQDTSGRYFLLFDGSDDWLQSAATINPGAVDKAQVFAGVRKLSDAAVGVVLESSASLAANNGTIQLLAPSTAGAPTYGFTSRGTSNGAATYNNAAVTAPVTNVVSGLADISAPSSILRVNGSQVGSNTSSQGTGNYLTYTHFIGRRNGATIPFNGRLYQMITRFGANLTADQIAATETFVNQRTGAY
jgi:hypothetical protein